MQRLENNTMLDRERRKLLNKLCKTCSRHRVIPTSMHIPDCSEDSVEVECGGFADVSQGTYKGHPVAIKVVRAYATSDLDVIRSVSALPMSSHPSELMDFRDSAERGWPGSTSGTPISYRCLE